jgi:hypothetical protein
MIRRCNIAFGSGKGLTSIGLQYFCEKDRQIPEFENFRPSIENC